MFRRLDEVCREDVIPAGNTSQFAISTIAAATERSRRDCFALVDAGHFGRKIGRGFSDYWLGPVTPLDQSNGR